MFVLAACIFVIWLLGRLGGKPRDGEIKTPVQVETPTDGSADVPESKATTSDAGSQEQDMLTPEEKERQKQQKRKRNPRYRRPSCLLRTCIISARLPTGFHRDSKGHWVSV